MAYEYKGSTAIISGLIQENNADFPIARASDIVVDDGTDNGIRLDEYLQNMGGGSGSGLPDYTEADNGKFLQIVDGLPEWVLIEDGDEVEY